MRTSTSRLANRLGRVCCLAAATGLAYLACWLFVLGEIPEIKLSERTAVGVFGFTFNGEPAPEWAFHFIPTGLLLAAMALFFVGLRVTRWSGRDDA